MQSLLAVFGGIGLRSGFSDTNEKITEEISERISKIIGRNLSSKRREFSILEDKVERDNIKRQELVELHSTAHEYYKVSIRYNLVAGGISDDDVTSKGRRICISIGRDVCIEPELIYNDNKTTMTTFEWSARPELRNVNLFINEKNGRITGKGPDSQIQLTFLILAKAFDKPIHHCHLTILFRFSHNS